MSNLAGVGAQVVMNDILPKILSQQANVSSTTATAITDKVQAQAEIQLDPQMQPKSGVKSVTVWAGAATILTAAAAAWQAYQAGDMNAVLTSAMTIVAGIGAIWGRYRATRTVQG